MIFFSLNSFGQTTGIKSDTIKGRAQTKTYLDLVLNLVSTNLNYGSANSSLTDYKKSVLGAQVGMSFRAGITPHLSLVPELYLIMRGGELKTNNPITGDKSTLRLYTLEMPVLARFHFGRFHVNAGPSIAYNVYGTRKMEDQTTTLVFNNTASGFKRWDAGIQLGGGYSFPTKRKNIVLDVRYNYGLTNLSYGQEMYNRSLIISLHFTKPWKTNPLARR
jgi:hypothetical protein